MAEIGGGPEFDVSIGGGLPANAVGTNAMFMFPWYQGTPQGAQLLTVAAPLVNVVLPFDIETWVLPPPRVDQIFIPIRSMLHCEFVLLSEVGLPFPFDVLSSFILELENPVTPGLYRTQILSTQPLHVGGSSTDSTGVPVIVQQTQRHVLHTRSASYYDEVLLAPIAVAPVALNMRLSATTTAVASVTIGGLHAWLEVWYQLRRV